MDGFQWSGLEQLNNLAFNPIEFDGINNRDGRFGGTYDDAPNPALFGMTAAEWRAAYPDKKGNMRDCAEVSQLVGLSNLENLNAFFIAEGLSQQERLKRLNKIVIHQMTLLTGYERRALPEEKEDIQEAEK